MAVLPKPKLQQMLVNPLKLFLHIEPTLFNYNKFLFHFHLSSIFNKIPNTTSTNAFIMLTMMTYQPYIREFQMLHYNHLLVMIYDCPLTGFETGSPRWQADSIPMCYLARYTLKSRQVSELWLEAGLWRNNHLSWKGWNVSVPYIMGPGESWGITQGPIW